MGMESALPYSVNMPPAAVAAAFDLGLSYHVFFNDAEPSCVVQSGDYGTVLPKIGCLVVVFPTHFSLDFQVHIGAFKYIYGRIHQDNSAQLIAVTIHAKMIRIGLSKFF